MEHRLSKFVVIFSLFAILNVNAEVKVETKIGVVIGEEKTVEARGQQYQLQTFLGIPYGKPPVGDLRFERSQPADSFKEPFTATKYSPACAQLKTPLFDGYEHQSEDCLYLNIYVPVQKPDNDSGHAVMVFIHGGGFEMGAGESYEGDRLAVLGNVIVVTINYRLGIFGFLSTGDDNIPGNMGLLDQHLALKWVNKHISSFGGDAARVTIFGESAGGSSVFYQGLYPENDGLIQRVIAQSGVPSMGAGLNSNPRPQFDFVVKGFECEADSVEQSVKCLKDKDTDTVIKTMEYLIEKASKEPENFLFVHFLITADGDFIKKDIIPAEVCQKSRLNTIPQVDFYRSLDFMGGYNSDDGAFMLSVPGFLPIEDAETFLPTDEDIANTLIHPPVGFNFGAAVPSTITSLIISQYTDWSRPGVPDGNRDKYAELWTDVFFGRGTNEFTIMHANSSDSGSTYLYLFSAPTSLHAILTPTWVKGANHADELPYVFNFMEKLVKDFNKSLTTDNLNDWEWELSYQMIKYWTNFAKSGNPNKPIENKPVWPEYDLNQQIAMDIGKDVSDKSAMKFFNAEKNNFWMETLPKVMEALQQGQGQSSGSHYSQDTCDAEKGCEND